MLFAPHKARPGHWAVSIRMDCVLVFLSTGVDSNYPYSGGYFVRKINEVIIENIEEKIF